MRLYYLFCFLIFASACSPKISSKVAQTQQPLADISFVLVLQQQNYFDNDGIELGIIKAGDNGLSVNCNYYKVIDKLKELARQKGANVIKITEDKSPDKWSSCERIKAKIYRVPDYKKHEIEIEWSANRRLTWNDFKGTPKSFSNPNVAAQTYCAFGYNASTATIFDNANIHTNSTFNCILSWVDSTQKNRPDLLEHEQGHFDLSEIYRRQLNEKLKEKNLKTYNLSDAQIILKEVYALYLDRQELYEKETNYGLNRQKQIEWNNIISAELKSLNSYN